MDCYIISGYSRSGKTTITEYLRKLGYLVESSSDILTIKTLQYCGIEINNKTIDVINNKKQDIFEKLYKEANNKSTDKSIRDFKIHVAENILVPRFGRVYFTNKCIKNIIKQLPNYNKNKVFIVSTIKEERFEIYNNPEIKDFNLFGINLISNFALKNVDKRSLISKDEKTNYIKIYKLENNGTIRDMYSKLENIIFKD